MKRYEQAKADYNYLKEHHGADCNDLTGGFVSDEAFFQLLEKPTKTKAYEIYCSLIDHYAVSGSESSSFSRAGEGSRPDFDDEEVCEIFRRNCNESEVLSSWGVDISE